MLLSLFLFALFVWVTYFLIISIKELRIELRNEVFCFVTEPLSFIFVLTLYIGLWLALAWLAYARWPWWEM